MTTYKALSQRIRAATSREELAAREVQCVKHYEAGTITATELARLDCMIMERIAKDCH